MDWGKFLKASFSDRLLPGSPHLLTVPVSLKIVSRAMEQHSKPQAGRAITDPNHYRRSRVRLENLPGILPLQVTDSLGKPQN